MPNNRYADQTAKNYAALSATDYPDLKDAKMGTEVTGTFSGRVLKNEEGLVTIEFNDFTAETENPADKEYKKMTERTYSNSKNNMDDEDEDEY